MNPNEIIDKLRLKFNEIINQNPIKLMDATLKDGTAIQISDMIVGGIVTINGTPAPSGEYEMADGSILVVGDNGAISEIKPAPMMPEEPPMAEDMNAKFSAFENTTIEKFAKYDSVIAKYEERLSEYERKLNESFSLIDGLINFSKKISDAPTGNPDSAVVKPNNFQEEKKQMSYDILFS